MTDFLFLMRYLWNDVKIKKTCQILLDHQQFSCVFDCKGRFSTGKLYDAAVVIPGKSIRFEGKKDRLSFGTVTADIQKKRHLEVLENGELKIMRGRYLMILKVCIFLFYDRVVGWYHCRGKEN